MARLLGQNEATGAAISGIEVSFDPAVLLHAIDLPNQGHRLDLKQIGETGLVDALVAGEVAQHLALRPGEAEEKKCALIEAPAKQAGDVVHEKAEAAVKVHRPILHAKELSIGDNKPIYLKRQPCAESRLVVRNSMAWPRLGVHPAWRCWLWQ